MTAMPSKSQAKPRRARLVNLDPLDLKVHKASLVLKDHKVNKDHKVILDHRASRANRVHKVLQLQ